MAEQADIRVAIADDEEGMRLILRKLIEGEEGFTLCGEAKDGRELLALAAEKRPQVCILDVEMPGLSGLECARLLQDTDPQTVLVFATAHEGYMAEAFEVYAFDYWVKPFKIDRAKQTLGRIRQALRRELPAQPRRAAENRAARGASGRIMLRHREGVHFVSQQDILLVQRENRATVLYAKGGRRFETSEPLGEVEARLDKRLFFRCHKSYIVNLNAVDSITPYGRWTYVVHLTGTDQDALITHDKYEELERMFS